MVDNRQHIRRQSDAALHEQVARQQASLERLFDELEKITRSLRDFENKIDFIDQKHLHSNTTVMTESIYQAQRQLLARFGVDVDDPKSVDKFRRGLQFSQAMEGGVTTATIAFITAFCGGMGMALWVIFDSMFRRS
jgi:uncharacterized membrane protein affecting hemolysin expression